MDLIPIECGSCKAKLKIKASPSRMPAEVKCPKCGKPIPLGKSAGSTSEQVQPAATVASPAPSAPLAQQPIPPPAASSTADLTPPPKPVSTPVATPPPPTAPKKAAAPIVLGQVNDSATGSMITAKCPACQWQTKVAQTLAGKKIRCKQCSGIILIATPDTPVVVIPIPATTGLVSLQPAETPVAIPVPAPAPIIAKPIPSATVRISPPPVADTPPTPVAPVSGPSQGTAILMGEISELRNKLDAARKETSLQTEKLNESERRAQSAEYKEQEAERRLKVAESRAQEAESAVHNMAGKIAVEGITANRKITELESQVGELNNRIASLIAEYKIELDVLERRASAMRDKITHFAG